MRYTGKHRYGAPRRIIIGDNMLVLSPHLDPVVVDELRRQWDEQVARPAPVFYLPAGVDWEAVSTTPPSRPIDQWTMRDPRDR